jgi:hypothetical protein
MNLSSDSPTLVHVILLPSYLNGYQNLADLQVPRIGLSAAQVASVALDDYGQAKHQQENPQLVIAFHNPDNVEGVAQLHKLHPSATTITVCASGKSQDTFAAIRDIAAVLNGPSLIGIDLEDVLSVLGSKSEKRKNNEVFVEETALGKLDSGLSACLKSLNRHPSTIEELLVLIAAPKGRLTTHELRQMVKLIRATCPNLGSLLYAVYDAPELTISMRMSLWASRIQKEF